MNLSSPDAEAVMGPPDTGPKDAVERVINLQQRLLRSLRPQLAGHWVSSDLTMAQLKVLGFLFTDGPSRMSTVANALNIALPSATGIVDRLVDRGLVLREPAPRDRRVVICSLSPEGERRIAELMSAGWQLLREMLGCLGREEIDAIERGLAIMVKAAEGLPRQRRPAGAKG